MFRQNFKETYFKNGYQSTPKSRRFYDPEDTPIVSEKQLALFGLVFSLLVIVTKVLHVHYDTIEKAFLEQKLVSYEVITEDGQVMFTYAWKTAVRYSRFWIPVLCGFLTSYFTWIMVYLDSNIPGVQPPSPLSPQKYKVQSGHTFHLNYVFAVLVGILVSFYMFFKGVSLEY